MSGIVVICQYIRLINREGAYVPNRNYQNLFIGETRSYDGINYRYAPYKIVGNGSIRGGDGIRANLTSVPNKITIPLTSDIVLKRYLMEVKQVFVTITAPIDSDIGPTMGNFEDTRLLNTQVWLCSSCTRDPESISIVLSSPLDAIQSHAPMRVYNSKIIGRAPATGYIAAR
jgi:hypothetical protein